MIEILRHPSHFVPNRLSVRDDKSASTPSADESKPNHLWRHFVDDGGNLRRIAERAVDAPAAAAAPPAGLDADGERWLAALLEEFPTADRQKLRQLVRNATDERVKNKPPRAFRDLFREVRELLSSTDTPDDEAAPE